MSMRRRQHSAKTTVRQVKVRSLRVAGKRQQRGRRTHFSTKNLCEPFAPPEDWFEPTGEEKNADRDFRIAVQAPGKGYKHVITPEQIRARLARLPQQFLQSLEIVQLSRMTQKKKSFPCYGMQWGTTLYLYPLEKTLEEYFYQPPSSDVINESKMYGGCWDEPSLGVWRLRWSQQAIEDFYLNNILIHELGHLNDDRNTSYTDRERYAEWFAIEYGYLQSGGRQARGGGRVRRRHHHV